MVSNEKSNYPNIPVKHWWALRKKFKSSIPTKVTPGYIATALGMVEISAKTNIIPSLILCGIIDSDRKPLERSKSWRDDELYPKVCEEIRKEIYPNELLEALPGPSPDKDNLKRWFATNLGVGKVAQGRLAAVYLLLLEANPSKEQDAGTSNRKTKKTPSEKKKSVEKPKSKPESLTITSDSESEASKFAPSVHVDIQIHISPDSPPDQIDQIFSSMSKYFKK